MKYDLNSLVHCNSNKKITIFKFNFQILNSILLDFSLTVKAAPHKCVIRTSQP